MSRKYILETIGHPGLYDPQYRKMDVHLCLPERDEEKPLKGIVLFIAGFEAAAKARVYSKMRDVFSDEYHLATVQCDYFGSKFMQEQLLPETEDDYCDMGPVQAMDCLIALKTVDDFLTEQGIECDRSNVIAYGHSQGAYLAYLMNVLMPGVLSCVIDNSAWLFPVYITNARELTRSDGERLHFEYLIAGHDRDDEIYHLFSLYTVYKNHARIISFHGMDDSLAPVEEKVYFSTIVDNMTVELIGKKRVDGRIFRSSTHGLDADFLEIFRYVEERYQTRSKYPVLCFADREFDTKKYHYHISNEDGIPILYCQRKEMTT